ncbi:dihydroxyacetone phosphate acyltransferase [Neocloeon triangulifer]|uniref:dihydroxyacetone phosphate acyltransferase n=1 Tax=Neocloeon triangulifer TaxID=2078957 RepID=UPI00286F5995|nr:dihydroxyacetone phosphate acyltransferase [Neocloeon triangulifer]
MGSNGSPSQIAEGTEQVEDRQKTVNKPPQLQDVLRHACPSSSKARLLSTFKNILERENCDFMWVTKEWRPQPVTQHSRTRSTAQIRQDVFASPKMQHTVEELSQQNGVPKEALWQELNEILVEMGHTQTMPVVRWFGYVLSKIMRKIYNGVYVNEESITRLRARVGNNPVIFMPSHRSYADFLLMSYVCFNYNIMLPVIAAGMDFVAMWGVGRLLRDSGAFFIRRSFGNDKLYWAAFSEYVQTLITAGENPIEFFVEGTRSRTAKSLCPKLGLLSVALEPYFTGQVSDILVVPINISYDRTLEETLYSYELLGVPKPKESTSGLFKALNVLDEQYGRIHIDFTEPISANNFFGDLRSPKLLRPLHLPHQITAGESSRIIWLANHVVRQQQKHAVISLFSLAAVVITHHSLTKPRNQLLKVQELTKEVALLKSTVESLGGLLDCRENLDVSLREALQIHKSLVHLSEDGVVRLKNVATQAAVAVDPTKLKGHNLQDKTLQVGVPMVMLQHYINQTLHLFICPAMICVAVEHSIKQGSGLKDDIFAKYQFLRKLLSHEFILHSAWEEMDFEESVFQLKALQVLDESLREPQKLCLGQNTKLFQIISHLLLPFLSGYSNTCKVLLETPAGKRVNLNDTLKLAQERIEKLLLNSHLNHHYSLSLDLLTAAVSSLSAMGSLSKHKENGKVSYSVNESRLIQVSQVLEDFFQMVAHSVRNPQEEMARQLVTREKARL